MESMKPAPNNLPTVANADNKDQVSTGNKGDSTVKAKKDSYRQYFHPVFNMPTNNGSQVLLKVIVIGVSLPTLPLTMPLHAAYVGIKNKMHERYDNKIADESRRMSASRLPEGSKDIVSGKTQNPSLEEKVQAYKDLKQLNKKYGTNGDRMVIQYRSAIDRFFQPDESINLVFALPSISNLCCRDKDFLSNLKETHPKEHKEIMQNLQIIADKYKDIDLKTIEGIGHEVERVKQFLDEFKSQEPQEQEQLAPTEKKNIEKNDKKIERDHQEEIKKCDNTINLVIKGLENPSSGFNPTRQIDSICAIYEELKSGGSEELKNSPEFKKLETIAEELKKYEGKPVLKEEELKALKGFLENPKPSL